MADPSTSQRSPGCLRTYVALDLETTGVDPRRDAIIEIGAVRFRGDLILDRFTTFIDPQRALPLRIQQITGITSQDLLGAPTIAQIIPELLAFVSADVDGVVAHNAGFDLGFLEAAGIRFHRPALDTYELATILLPGQSSYSLGELCQSLDIRLDHAHRALADAEAAARLMMDLCRRLWTLPEATRRLLAVWGEAAQWPPSQLFADTLMGQPLPPAPLPPAEIESLLCALLQSQPPPHPPLQAAPHLPELSADLLHRAFAQGGPLAGLMGDGYESRAGQVNMAQAVLRTLVEGDQMLIEAGTGIGKSLAYLLPAALWSLRSGQRVVIATDTITLQEQLIAHELPRVAALAQALLPEAAPLRGMLLKGRSHYLCVWRLQRWLEGRTLSSLEMRLLAKALVWLPHTRSGDLGELAIHAPKERELCSQIASDGRLCGPDRCGRPGSRLPDFHSLAQRYAEAAHLLIVNHALFMADARSHNRLLPAYDYLIVDEAHRLEAAATEQLTFRANRQLLEQSLALLRLNPGELGRLSVNPSWQQRADFLAGAASVLDQEMTRFFDSLANFVRQGQEEAESGPQRIGVDGLRVQPRWSQVEVEWDSLRRRLESVNQALHTLTKELTQAGWDRQPLLLETLGKLEHAHEQLSELSQQISRVIFQPVSSRQEQVGWLEIEPVKRGKGRVNISFCVAPIFISDLLEKQIFHKRRGVVLTGATLRTDEGFEFMQERLGCWDANFLVVESPFNYRKNALLYLPSDMPTPDRHGYQQAVERAIVDAARSAQGRTLVLFTSYGHLRATADPIRRALDQAGVTLLEHGFSSRSRLLREFRTGKRSVLMGTGTFWEGIDLPGEILSCLVIVRLPFAVPTDPLFAARSRVYDDPFNDYTVPDAVLRFRQGFGRLIRTTTDRGVVVLLDSRAWQRSYGSAFLDALPGCTLRRSPLSSLADSVEQWLALGDWSDRGWPGTDSDSMGTLW